MKRFALIILALPLLLTSCSVARIVTVSPNPYKGTYTTTVTVPKQTVTTVTNVTATSYDMSLGLNLKAVGAAFAQAANVSEFEYLLNNSSYMISNLDLNNDGYVDYLRVMETREGYNTHLFVIQAVVGPNMYQDVATLVAEDPSFPKYHVQIIGAPYIYGPQYIIEPVYVVRPRIFTYLCRTPYKPWRSPWYWSHYPSCYRHPAPVYLSHYHAYVDTYMHNHRYCHEVHYVNHCHYRDYDRVYRPMQRNDYGQKYPERSFTVRNANMPARADGRAVNARDVMEVQRAATKSTTSSTSRSASSTSRTASPTSGSANSRTAATTGSSSSTRTAGTTSSASRTTTTSSSSRTSSGSRSTSTSSSSPSTKSSTTTVNSRVGASGTVSTSRTVSSSSSSRSASSSSSSGSRSSSTTSSSSRSSSSSTSRR